MKLQFLAILLALSFITESAAEYLEFKSATGEDTIINSDQVAMLYGVKVSRRNGAGILFNAHGADLAIGSLKLERNETETEIRTLAKDLGLIEVRVDKFTQLPVVGDEVLYVYINPKSVTFATKSPQEQHTIVYFPYYSVTLPYELNDFHELLAK